MSTQRKCDLWKGKFLLYYFFKVHTYKMFIEDEVSIDQLAGSQDILEDVSNPNRIYFVTSIPSHGAQTGSSDQSLPNSHFCSFCGSQFENKRCLLLHSLQHREDRPVICSICAKTFKHKAHLSMHMHRHRTCSCPLCGHTFPDREKLDFHKKSHRSQYTCAICKKLFASNKSLEIHKVSHNGNAPYACKLCSFFYKHSLTGHTCCQVPAPKEKQFTCDLCGKSYRFRSEVVRHRKHHDSIKDWPCRVCGKIYALQSTLKTHLKIHAAQKPFLCALCTAGFMKKALLEKHIGRIHLQLSSTVLCHRCPKLFYDYSDLKYHMMTHNKEEG